MIIIGPSEEKANNVKKIMPYKFLLDGFIFLGDIHVT